MTGRIVALDAARVRVSDRTEWTFIRVRTDCDRVGIGECSDSGSLAELCAALAAAEPAIRGLHVPRDRAVLQQRLRSQLAAFAPLTSRTVTGALGLALWDLTGQMLEIPLWALFGGDSAPEPVRLYANINRAVIDRRPASFGVVAAAAVADGFTAVKCAPFDAHGLDPKQRRLVGVAAISEVRAAVGEDTTVLVDLHHQLTYDDLLAILPDLERYNVGWLEDAVELDRPDRVFDLARRTVIPLAGGELAATPSDVVPALMGKGLAVVLPDIKHAGGPSKVRDIAVVAAALGAEVSLHNPTGPVATAASVHLVGALPAFTVLEFAYGEASHRGELINPVERPLAGALAVPDGPGLGVSFDDSRVQFGPPRSLIAPPQ